jgi:hypothetical protein
MPYTMKANQAKCMKIFDMDEFCAIRKKSTEPRNVHNYEFEDYAFEKELNFNTLSVYCTTERTNRTSKLPR